MDAQLDLDAEMELSEAEMHFYSRQILLDGWDLEAQEKLKLANVLIVGCGGIGCTTAELLARAGVGQITLIDADQIEISNLQRQIAYTEQDLGFYKSEILAKRLGSINPHIRVIAHTVKLDASNAEHLIAAQDLVLDGCDNFTTRYLVNAQCYQHAVPLISASAIGFQGHLWSKQLLRAMNVYFLKNSMPVKVYAVRILGYWRPRQMSWLVYKHIMHCCIWG